MTLEFCLNLRLCNSWTKRSSSLSRHDICRCAHATNLLQLFAQHIFSWRHGCPAFDWLKFLTYSCQGFRDDGVTALFFVHLTFLNKNVFDWNSSIHIIWCICILIYIRMIGIILKITCIFSVYTFGIVTWIALLEMYGFLHSMIVQPVSKS